MKSIYFDYIASTPVNSEVMEKMLPYFTDTFGNPQSRHGFGKKPREALQNARIEIAELIGALPEEIYFTSSGTEGNNTVLNGLILTGSQSGKKHIITSVIEHHSILHCCKRLEKSGFEVTCLGVDKNGFINPDDVEKAIRKDTALISIMHANNEVGTIQPIEKISEIAHQKRIPFHSDGVASVGIIPVNVKEAGLDFMSFSSQQMYGPKGAGALYVKKGARFTPFLLGGIQESGRRAGTENIPAIVGMGAAAKIAKEELGEQLKSMTSLRDRLIKGIQNIDYTYITGDLKCRLPNIVSCCIQYVEGEAMTMMLEAKGIMASSGSTCSSHALKASAVILSIGIPPDIAQGSLVFALGKETTIQDIDYVTENLPQVVDRLRSMSPLYEDLIKQKKSGE